jgi:hypothetical protein
MAKRVQLLCQYLVDEYDGDASAIWRDAASGDDGRDTDEAAGAKDDIWTERGQSPPR